MIKIDIYAGDCIKSLKNMPEQSINTCITSPPYYGLRDYGVKGQLGLEETPKQFVDNLVNVFKEVRRVLRDDGTVWLNLGDSYGAQNGKGFNTHADKGLTNRSTDMQERYGNISSHNNMKERTGLPPKSLIGIPFKVAFAMQEDGWILRQDIIWHKPNPMPESVRDRCTKAHEYIFLFSKNKKYYYDNEAIKEDSVSVNSKGEKGKPNSVKNIGKSVEGVDGFDVRKGFKNMGAYPKKNKRSVWTVATQPFKEAHFATYPTKLIEPCILAGCPEKSCINCGEPYLRKVVKSGEIQRRWSKNNADGSPYEKQGSMQNIYKDMGLQKQCDCQTNETKGGTVLDPFAGSGTTGIVAANHNCNSVLLELNEEYIELAKDRIKKQTTADYNLEIFK